MRVLRAEQVTFFFFYFAVSPSSTSRLFHLPVVKKKTHPSDPLSPPFHVPLPTQLSLLSFTSLYFTHLSPPYGGAKPHTIPKLSCSSPGLVSMRTIAKLATPGLKDNLQSLYISPKPFHKTIPKPFPQYHLKPPEHHSPPGNSFSSGRRLIINLEEFASLQVCRQPKYSPALLI